MIVRKNKEKIINLFNNGKLDELEILVPNISDYVMKYADEVLKLDNIVKENLDINTHIDSIRPEIFIYALISSKLKRLFSVSQSVLAITEPSIIDKFELNITSNKKFTCEGNMRKFINKLGKSDEITDEKIEEEKKIRDSLNKNKKEKYQKSTDYEVIKKELQIKQNGNKIIETYNQIVKSIIEKIERPTIHILDCVKIPVNISNDNYELSTVINYEGKPMRGYKMGVLRAVTEFGGLMEYLIDGTISTNDINLTEEKICNYSGFKENDYLIMDRGFAKIDFVTNLVKRGINVIVPVKRGMAIYNESINIAISSEDGWIKHPNVKRKGQEIKLIKDLKGIWISEKNYNKKPEKVLKEAIDLSACVIRIDKTVEENQKILESTKKSEEDTDKAYEDERYIYIVIISTNTELSATQVIRYYESRPEIEEDFRQLKDIWKCCNFTSTKYVFVMCQIAMTFLAYNLFNMYKASEDGNRFINKSMKTISNEEKRYKVPFSEIKYLVVIGGYYCLFDGVEFLDLYADCTKDIRKKIKPLLAL